MRKPHIPSVGLPTQERLTNRRRLEQQAAVQKQVELLPQDGKWRHDSAKRTAERIVARRSEGTPRRGKSS
jgi:hypothetical protein